jgi:hypothetical protein
MANAATAASTTPDAALEAGATAKRKEKAKNPRNEANAAKLIELEKQVDR